VVVNRHAHVVKDAKWFGGYLASVLLVMAVDVARLPLMDQQQVQQVSRLHQLLQQKSQQQLQPQRHHLQQPLSQQPTNLADLAALDVHVNLVEFGGCVHQDAAQTVVAAEMEDLDVVILKLPLLNHHHLAVHALLVWAGRLVTHADVLQTAALAQTVAVDRDVKIRLPRQQQYLRHQSFACLKMIGKEEIASQLTVGIHVMIIMMMIIGKMTVGMIFHNAIQEIPFMSHVNLFTDLKEIPVNQ
jgi:hypothetical protein